MRSIESSNLGSVLTTLLDLWAEVHGVTTRFTVKRKAVPRSYGKPRSVLVGNRLTRRGNS